MSSCYGYIRVSSRDQNEDRQLIAMQELNIPPTHVYIDKQSGKTSIVPNTKDSCASYAEMIYCT